MNAARSSRSARLLGRVGAGCARHRWVVVTVWTAITLALVGSVLALGRPTDDDVVLPGSDAQIARDLAEGATSNSALGSGTIIVQTAQGRLDDAAHAPALNEAEASLRGADHVTSVRRPSASTGSLSADGRTGYFTVALDVDRRNVTPAVVDRLLEAASPAADVNLRVIPGGAFATAADRSGGHRNELVGLGVAAIVLTFTLGGFLGAVLPLLSSLVAISGAVCTIGLAGHLTPMPGVATTLATMVGLGVGIDYALFLLTRYRDLLRTIDDVPAAMSGACADSGSAVVFAGGTVAVALAGLSVSGVPVLGTLAWTSGVAVAFAVLATITLLPALTAIGGRRLIRPAGTQAQRGRGWARLADRVTRHPLLVATASLLLLAGLAVPAADLSLGQVDAGDSPPGSAARTANDVLATAFGPGSTGPLTVVTELDGPGTLTPAALGAALRAVPGVIAVSAPAPSAAGTVLTSRVTPSTAPSDPATADLVHRLRALDVPGVRGVHVGGVVAAKADLAQRVRERMPWAILLVLTLATAVLLVAFRAPLVALKAAFMDLVSVGAAYGALTAVFSWGWGVQLTGLSGPVPIESYVPLMLFALLFGLSMDYEVFLLSAVQRSWRATGDNLVSVREGVASTGAVITSAATIMVSVFAGFVLDDDPAIKMFGLGLAVAVTVDATVVRGLLAPATMALMGAVTWWTPSRRPPDARPAGQGVRQLDQPDLDQPELDQPELDQPGSDQVGAGRLAAGRPENADA